MALTTPLGGHRLYATIPSAREAARRTLTGTNREFVVRRFTVYDRHDGRGTVMYFWRKPQPRDNPKDIET